MQLTFAQEFSHGGKSLRLGFVVDPLSSRKSFNDPGVALMRAAERHGHEVFAIDSRSLGWRRPEPGHAGGVFGEATHLHLRPDDHDWYRETGREWQPLKSFDAVVLRKDPPFDGEYQALCALLERAEADGVRVFNRPQAVRTHAGRLAICEFPAFTPTTLVARAMALLQHFIDEQRDVILKPLDATDGRRVFRIHRNDPNRNVIVETLTERGRRSVLAQRYLPEISHGDKRVLLIGGKVVPFALARIPKAGETRGTLAAGGTGVAQELTPRERDIAETLAPILFKRGLLLAGIDLIGGQLTEINVTHPSGLVEIRQQTGFDAASACISALEHQCGAA